MNKFVLCWLSPRYLPEQDAFAERSQIYHSEREGLLSSSSQSLNFIGTGKPVAWLSHLKRLGQDEFSEREQPADVSRSNESVFRDANPANVVKSLLEGNRVHLLTQARSELMKQEDEVESLNNCINECQQQAYAQRLDLENAHHGYIEYRREHVRLPEELVMKEKALREDQIRSMHEMGKMKRAQELRVDEFSVQKLRESFETIQRLTSQVQEKQERMNYLYDSGEFHEVESNCSGKIHTFPVNQQGFQVRDLCWASTNACNLKHGIHLDYRKTFLQIHVRRSSHHKCLIKEFIHLWRQMPQVRLPRSSAQGNLWQERMKE